MKNLYILILILATMFSLQAQEQGTNHLITYLNLNVYSGTVETTLPDGTEPIESDERTSFTLGNFSPAMGFYHLNNNFSEIELTTLFFGSEDKINLIEDNNREVAGKTSQFGLGVRYEYNFALLDNNNIKLYAGASVNPTISSMKLKPESEYLYTTGFNTFKLPLAIAPKVIYNLGESFFMTYSIPITLFEIGTSSINYESSVVPSGGQKASESTTTFLPARTHVRIGVGAKF